MKKVFSLLLITLFLTVGSASLTGVSHVAHKGEGKASWYGPGFHGKKTASGEIYDMNDFTAAHKTLPFGTKVKITNLRNGKSIIVEVNDRGPYVKSRNFDLSKAAFSAIGNVNSGVISISYEVIA